MDGSKADYLTDNTLVVWYKNGSRCARISAYLFSDWHEIINDKVGKR
ncbi:MAG: hypothetical protein U5K54_04750 [Cytophagales bacterium]|nr:hypothetical protein [Cytophagales bacterium]